MMNEKRVEKMLEYLRILKDLKQADMQVNNEANKVMAQIDEELSK